ncbi:MAG: ABC transporter permease [Oligoflexia bacterium]|nr:ABC transporter permease [Oligoflexia bacterium]
MIRVALTMLRGDSSKFIGLVVGIAFASFLVAFASAFFAGFMTRGFSLISENPEADVWVMDPAVQSVEQTVNLPSSALSRVRSVAGVVWAAPMALGKADARFANGSIQSFDVIGVDDITLAGAPAASATVTEGLRLPQAAIVDAGGTEGKLQTPVSTADQWPQDGPHLDAPTRELRAGDELLLNNHRVRIVGHSHTLPRFPPRPLLYMSLANADRILPPGRHRITFVLVSAAKGVDPQNLAQRIHDQTGLRARSTEDFKTDTVRWYLVNSEDVGDMGAMMSLAASVGFGVTAVMLFMFTTDHLRQYAVIKAMGATTRQIVLMVFAQASAVAVLGTGIGMGVCVVVGTIAARGGYPFRLMWFAPAAGGLMVAIISVLAALISVRPAVRLEPGVVFSSR